MTDPPLTPTPDSTSVPARAAAAGSDPDDDFDAVVAGFDPGLHGLDSAVFEQLAEPPRDDPYRHYPGDDDDDDGDDGMWLAGLAADQGAAFAAAAPLDVLAPGGALAGCAGHALDGGLAGLSDDALVGLLRATRRVAAWQSGIELAAVAELDHRRLRESRRPGWSRVSETIAAELAAALVLTGRSADSLLGFARDLARLPAVLQALLDGRIDRARAAVFAAGLAALGDQAANAAAAQMLDTAGSLTTGQLRHALRTLIHLLDPAAVRKRMHKARKDTRVEAWQETSGNHGLAGRELDPADAAAADQRITAIARALQAAGADGTLDQLRADVFTALLAGRDPDTLLPPQSDAQADGTHTGPARPPTAETGGADGPTDRTGPAPGSLAALAGTVHLTLPASAWLGLADLPGETAGLGPIDAWTSRDLATRLAAADTLARWCITLTNPDGTAAAHACTRTPPPGDPAARRSWLTRQTFTWPSCQPCQHPTQVPGYRPANVVRDFTKARNRTCTFPGCRRPATTCDLDHTTPWDQGGRTCPCNLAPLCRQHHQVKQTPGWNPHSTPTRHPHLDRTPRPQLHRPTQHLYLLTTTFSHASCEEMIFGRTPAESSGC
jgi:hypothetical protein